MEYRLSVDTSLYRANSNDLRVQTMVIAIIE